MTIFSTRLRSGAMAALGVAALGLGACATHSGGGYGYETSAYGDQGVVLDAYMNGYDYVYTVRNDATGEITTISMPASEGVYQVGDAVWIDNGYMGARSTATHGYAGGYNSYETRTDMHCVANQACGQTAYVPPVAPAYVPPVTTYEPAPVTTTVPTCTITTYDDCGTGTYATDSYSYSTDSYSYSDTTTYTTDSEVYYSDEPIYVDCDLVTGMNCGTTETPTTVYTVPSDSITWTDSTTYQPDTSTSVIYTDCSTSTAPECRK